MKYNEISCKVFRYINFYLMIPLNARAKLVFYCCVYTKINTSAASLLLPPLFLVVSFNHLFKLGKGLLLM